MSGDLPQVEMALLPDDGQLKAALGTPDAPQVEMALLPDDGQLKATIGLQGPPGPPGPPGPLGHTGGSGPPGLDGSVVGTLPYTAITGVPTAQLDAFYVTTPGTQTLHLTHTPQGGRITLFLNGMLQADISDVQISGTVISVPLSWSLFSPDLLAVQYNYLP